MSSATDRVQSRTAPIASPSISAWSSPAGRDTLTQEQKGAGPSSVRAWISPARREGLTQEREEERRGVAGKLPLLAGEITSPSEEEKLGSLNWPAFSARNG